MTRASSPHDARRRRAAAGIAILLAAVAVVAWLLLRGGPAPEASPAADEGADLAVPPPPATSGRAGLAGGGGVAGATGPSPAGSTAAGDSPAVAGASRQTTLVGGVVGESRRPIEGASVAWHPSLRATVEGRTDAAGRFRLPLPARTAKDADVAGMLLARAPAGVALVSKWAQDPGAELDVGTIELRPAATVRVSVRRWNGPCAGARVVLLASGERADPTPVGERTADAEGSALFEGVPVGTVTAWAETPEGELGRKDDRAGGGGAEGAVVVFVSSTEDVEVRVIDAETKKPVAGARVVPEMRVPRSDLFADTSAPLIPRDVAPTDAQGRTRVPRVAQRDPLEATVHAAGFASARVDLTSPITTVEVARREEKVFRIDRDVPGQPPAGTTVSVRTADDETVTGLVDETSLHVRLEDGHGGLAIAPDGSVAVLADRETPIAFRPRRRLVVTVVDERGAPQPGIAVAALTDGESAGARTTVTDARGAAAFADLTAGFWNVVARFADGMEHDLDRIDGTEGDVEQRVLLHLERTLVVRTRVFGEARLPSDVAAWLEEGIAVRTEEDPETGSLRMTVRPTDPSARGRVHVGARGMRTVVAEFSWPAAGGTVETTAEFGDFGVVTVVVRAPEGSDDFVRIERIDAAGDPRSRYVRDGTRGSVRRRHVDLAPGRYQLVDVRSGIASEPFEVADRSAPIEVVLDLTGTVGVAGRVTAPTGTDVDRASVAVTGPRIAEKTLLQVESDGRFRTRVPAGGRYVLEARHPDVRPAREGGRAVVEGARDDVVLALAEGPRVRVRLVDPAGVPVGRESWETAQLGFPAPSGTKWLRLKREEDGAYVARGAPEGRTVAWLEMPPFAPHRLDTTVGEDVTDLGEVRLSRGSTLSVRFRGKGKPEGTSLAEFAKAPGLVRDFEERATAGEPWRLVGLAAGTWTLSLYWTTEKGEPGERKQDVEVDGVTDSTIEVTVD